MNCSLQPYYKSYNITSKEQKCFTFSDPFPLPSLAGPFYSFATFRAICAVKMKM